MKFLLQAWLSRSLTFAALILALKRKGFQVHVAAPSLPAGQPVRAQLEALGLQVHNIPIARTGTNPLADLKTLWALWRLMREVKPNAVLGYTIKPVIYGTFAAWLAGVPQCFALITGLGYAFQGDGNRGRLQALVQQLYALALARVQKVFFQNPDDQAVQAAWLLAANTPSCVVNGSGVDVASFSVQPLPAGGQLFTYCPPVGRQRCARVCSCPPGKGSAPQAQFTVVGWIDSNPDAIQQHELDDWVAAGTIHFMGRLSDVRPAIVACSVYVLPSYREGTPRTVLEAMAMGRAIITTDAPGCRETVVHGDNGLLVPVKSVNELAQAMCRFIDEPGLSGAMGARSRRIAEDKYDVHKVNAVMLSEMGLN